MFHRCNYTRYDFSVHCLSEILHNWHGSALHAQWQLKVNLYIRKIYLGETNLDVILVTFGSLCAWGPTLSMMRVCVREERGGDEEEGLWDVGCTLYHPCSINCNFCWWPTRFWTDKIIASCKTFNKSFKLKGKCVITDAIGGGGFYIYYIVHLVHI